MKSNRSNKFLIATATAVLAFSAQHLRADEPADPESYDVAMQLANPVASLISMPLQNNFDWGAGPNGDGFQYRINIQPVIPFTFNDQWTVPFNLGVAQLVKIGGSLVQFQLGGRYYAETPDKGPDWGLRFNITFLWPR